MRKILILMSFILPVALMAQTRPAPKKAVDRPVSKNNAKFEKPASFSYLIMHVVEKKTKKQVSALEFKFKSFDKRYSEKIFKDFENVNSVVDALNKLGQRGWELVSVENGRYFFKSRFVGVKR
jgi:phosphoglycolate phosphatase-like HAD superfamily hydrolase